MRRVIDSIEVVHRSVMRVGLLVAAALAFVAAGGSPALAACTGGATVTCDDTTNQNFPDGFGTPALDNTTINVLTNKKVEGDNDGLNIGTGNTVNNNGTIYGNGSFGVGLAAGIEAAGSLTVNNASGATIKGFSNGIVAGTATVTNNGTIVAIDALNQATGIGTSGDLNLVNNGQILGGYGVFVNGTANITNNVGASIVGTFGWGGISTSIANILNNGTVSATGGGTGIDTNTGTITNNSVITAAGGGGHRGSRRRRCNHQQQRRRNHHRLGSRLLGHPHRERRDGEQRRHDLNGEFIQRNRHRVSKCRQCHEFGNDLGQWHQQYRHRRSWYRRSESHQHRRWNDLRNRQRGLWRFRRNRDRQQ
jgi:hypothetical protein